LITRRSDNIGAHLASVVPAIREAQGGELRAGPSNTSLPVILEMDSNAQAGPLPEDLTYMDFIAADCPYVNL
jgi:hypothetical protein